MVWRTPPTPPDIVTFNQSDIPESEINGLDCEELLLVFNKRFNEAGKPWDKLTSWLDDHYVGKPDDDPVRRVLFMDWWGVSALMREAKHWRDEA